MTSKKKLKRKLRRQKTTHLLEMSDLRVELDKLKYNLTFEKAKVQQLEYDVLLRQAEIDDLLERMPSMLHEETQGNNEQA